jgi:hypothetical protein
MMGRKVEVANINVRKILIHKPEQFMIFNVNKLTIPNIYHINCLI